MIAQLGDIRLELSWASGKVSTVEFRRVAEQSGVFSRLADPTVLRIYLRLANRW
jgi:hypothetical protein